MLKDVFNRGQVCWAAPFGHMVWVDENGTPYDIEGKYQGEAFYFIPEDMCGDSIIGFKHCDLFDKQIHPISKPELISLIKKYCEETGEEYNERVELFMTEKS